MRPRSVPQIAGAFHFAREAGRGLALTWLTVLTAKQAYGAFNTPIALSIAGIKAALVILYFMHVKYSSKPTQLIAFAGFFWLTILLVFTLDFMPRDLLDVYFFMS